jgi:hypothetical protein
LAPFVYTNSNPPLIFWRMPTGNQLLLTGCCQKTSREVIWLPLQQGRAALHSLPRLAMQSCARSC